MRVREIMTAKVEMVEPDAKIQDAAKRMAAADVGMLPVGEDERLVGMITDRDIAIRSVAEGKSPAQTKVRDVMTRDVLYCFDDQDADDVAANMANIQVRRLPVVDRAKRLVGIVSLADFALRYDPRVAGEAFQGVCVPDERDS